jgi:hypothetical protein
LLISIRVLYQYEKAGIIMRHGRKDPWDKPWVAYAAIGGVVVVIVLALVYFFGGGGTAGSPAISVPGTSGQSPGPVHTTMAIKYGIAPTIQPVSAAPTVAPEGISVRVSYLGGFSGSYGVTNSLVKVQNSGDRVYTVDATNGTITASFHKDDGSKHVLTVEIWKDGKVVKSGNTPAPNGAVNLSYQA